MSKVFQSSLAPVIDNVISQNRNVLNIERNVSKYIDKNNEVLYAIGPLYRLYFTDADRETIFDMFGIKPKYIEDLVDKIDDVNSSWKIVSDPFNVIMTMIIRELTIKKKTETCELAIMYLTLSLYSSLHYKYYRYPPNENCMVYTINNMSNKFLIKKYGVLYKALEHIAMKSHETYEANLIKGEDLNIKDYVMNLRTRLNHFMQKITNEYMINYKNKKYLNTEDEVTDEEGYRKTTNISLEIENIVNKTSNRFFGSEIELRFLRAAANQTGCHPETLLRAIEEIRDKESDNVLQLIRYILQIYFSNPSNTLESLKTKQFVSYCLSLYSKSNIKDDNVIALKKLLDFFLNSYCNRYSDTEREATKVNYRKSLYIYFVLMTGNSAVR